MTDFNIVVKADADSAEKSIESLVDQLRAGADAADDLSKASGEAGAALGEGVGGKGKEAASSASEGLGQVNDALRSMKTLATAAFSFVGVSFGISALIGINDQLIVMNNRIASVSGASDDLGKKIADIANLTRTSQEGLVGLYTRLASSTTAYKLSQEQLLDITRTLSEIVSLSGLSFENGGRAINNFVLALGRGEAAGGALRRVFQQVPELLVQLQKETGKTADQLYKLGAPEIIKSILEMGSTIDKAFNGALIPVNQAVTQFQNRFSDLVGAIGKSTGVFSGISNVILFFANNMAITAPIIATFAFALASLLVVTTVRLAMQGLTDAVTGLRNIIIGIVSSPMTILIGLFTALAVIAGVLAYKNIPAFKDALDGVFKTIKDAVTPAMAELRKGIDTTIGSTGGVAAAQKEASAAFDQTTSAMKRQTAAAYETARAIQYVGSWAERTQRNYYNRTYGDPNANSNPNLDIPGLTSVGSSGNYVPPDYSYNNTVSGGANSIIQMATGGEMTPGALTLVGEQGPELIVPKQSGVVIPAATTSLIKQLANTLAQTMLGEQLAKANQFSTSDMSAADFGALQNVFSGGFGGASGAGGSGSGGSGSGGGIDGPDFVPRPAAFKLADLTVQKVQDIYAGYSEAMQTSITQGHITSAQGQVLAAALAQTVADWAAFQGDGSGTGGGNVLSGGPNPGWGNAGGSAGGSGSGGGGLSLLSGTNGFWPYFGDVRKIVKKNNWVDEFIAHAFGSDLAGGIMDPYMPDNSADAGGSGSGAGGAVTLRPTGFYLNYNEPMNPYVGWPGHFDSFGLVPSNYVAYGSQWTTNWNMPNLGYWSGIQWGPPGAGHELDYITRARFASGGAFTVGGAGGTDSQLVQFMASPNERVTVETPDQQKAGRGGGPITVNINLTGVTDVSGFRKSQPQITAELETQLQRIRNRGSMVL